MSMICIYYFFSIASNCFISCFFVSTICIFQGLHMEHRKDDGNKCCPRAASKNLGPVSFMAFFFFFLNMKYAVNEYVSSHQVWRCDVGRSFKWC